MALSGGILGRSSGNTSGYITDHVYLIQTFSNSSIDRCLEVSDRWQLQRNLAIDRRVEVNQTSRDVQHNSMHLQPVHTKNDIDPLAFQDEKGG
jgi:hypothetical protein